MKKLPARLKSQHEPCTNSTPKANAKIWRAATTFLLFTFCFLLFAIPAFAACTPPDYSNCPVARTGPKIAGNTNPENYAKIRQEYNATGYTNQWIPTTIIYTVETPYEVLRDNLREMKNYGLLPIIRPWDSTNTENIKRFASDLNQALKEIGFPHDIVVYAFNEPNLPEGPYRANPEAAAIAIGALIQGAGENPIYKIYLPPIAGHQGGAEETFAREILEYQMPDGRTIGQAIDGAALTMYQWTAEEFQADFERWVNLLSQYGVGEIIISELGPYKNGRLLQNLGDIPEWETKMSEIFRRIQTDPSFLAKASLINTSFFLDVDGDGKADITLLVIIDENGTVKVIIVPLKGSIFWPGEGKWQKCGLSSGAQDSRPDACPIPICNITDKLTASCATAFSAVDSISFQRREGNLCEEDYWVEDTWGGTVEINLSETTVPFVGKKGMEDRQKYLADYFEGICPYYTGKLCPRPENPEEIWTGQAETGVWQWLAPQETQDEFKIKMVERVIKSKQGTEPEPIHDYLVTDGARQRYLSQFKGHFPPKPEDYPTYEAYSTAKTAWEKTEWGMLWPYVPMFSREDTQGWVFPYAGLRPGLPLDKEHFYVEPKETKVPHLARLYEVTKAIQELLLSWGWIGQETQAQKDSPALLASRENVLGEKILLAQGPGCVPCGCKYYYGDSLGDCSCMGRIKPDGEPECRGEHAGGNGCPIKKHWHEYGTLCGWTDCQPEQRGCSPGQVCCGESVGPSPGPPPAPIPACGLRPPAPVNLCQKPAIMDSNPNDDICCGSIYGDLVATDQVKNTEYTECATDPPLPGDPCLKRVSKQVSRQIGINLLHPYLSEIWGQMAALPDGIFNFFRPNAQTEFPDIDAASRVTYGYPPGSAEPSVGQFYYPYLGGVQKAKEWLVNYLLNPSVAVAF